MFLTSWVSPDTTAIYKSNTKWDWLYSFMAWKEVHRRLSIPLSPVFCIFTGMGFFSTITTLCEAGMNWFWSFRTCIKLSDQSTEPHGRRFFLTCLIHYHLCRMLTTILTVDPLWLSTDEERRKRIDINSRPTSLHSTRCKKKISQFIFSKILVDITSTLLKNATDAIISWSLNCNSRQFLDVYILILKFEEVESTETSVFSHQMLHIFSLGKKYFIQSNFSLSVVWVYVCNIPKQSGKCRLA